MLTNEDLPRVLIVSVNPLSETSNNGKTYSSFFEGYPAAKIAQLYFHRELPTSSVAKSYFRVSDEDVLRFVLRKSRSLGVRVSPTIKADQLLSVTATRRLASSNLVRLARAGALSRLLQKGYGSIARWLREFEPEIIFFSGGNATHLYPLVERISDDFAAPIVNYVTDDYVLPISGVSPTGRLVRSVVRRHFLRLSRRSARVLTIGDKMTSVYAERFGIKSTPIMNLVDLVSMPSEDRQPVEGRPLVLCYAGGLHFNRWQTLARIGASLDRLAGLGAAELHIYTATVLDKRMEHALSGPKSITLKDSVDARALAQVYSGADLLIHVESFARRDRDSTYLSVSTKIPEYLAAGRPIFAVGPEDVASMEYVRSSGAAFTVSSLEDADMDAVLRRAMTDGESREDKARRARVVALENHEGGRARRHLWADLVDIAQQGVPPDSGATRR